MSGRKGSKTTKSIGKFPRIIDTSYEKLRWNVRGVFNKIIKLQEQLNNRMDEVPLKNKNERKKIFKWQKQINEILQKVEYIKEIKINEVEDEFNYNFENTDLFVLSFVHLSTRNTFKELKKYFDKLDLSPISEKEFDDLIYMGDAARVLALIGDAAIDLALIHIIWNPNISKVGDLSKQRDNFVSNKNLARICDKLDLYNSRIDLGPTAPNTRENTILHTKGTIIESIFGVIYIESGWQQIISSINVLK